MYLNWLSEQPGLSPHYYYCASCSATYNSCSAFVSMHETRGQTARIQSAHGQWSIIILIQGSCPACTRSEWRSSPGHILIISKCRTCWVHEQLFERIMWIKCFLHKESVQKATEKGGAALSATPALTELRSLPLQHKLSLIPAGHHVFGGTNVCV